MCVVFCAKREREKQRAEACFIIMNINTTNKKFVTKISSFFFSLVQINIHIIIDALLHFFSPPPRYYCMSSMAKSSNEAA